MVRTYFPQTMPELLHLAAAEYGDTLALATETERATYAEVAAAARRLAGGLLAMGVEPGGRVAICLPNGPDWLVAHWATALLGGVVVPINTRNRPAETRYMLMQSEASVLILMGHFLKRDYLEDLPALLAGGHPTLQRVVIRESEKRPLPWETVSWSEVMNWGDAIPTERLEQRIRGVRPEDTHVILYTSGTTGHPKGAMLTHRGLLQVARSHSESWGIQPGEAIFVPNPMSHIMGMMLGCIMPAVAQVTTVSMAAFEVEQALALISRWRAVAMAGIPTHFQMLADHPELHRYDISSLRIGLSAGATFTPDSVRRAMTRLGLEAILTGIGQTEASGSITRTDRHDMPEIHATTLGRPLPWLQAKVVDPETLQEQPPGKPGELWARGPMVMKGYFRAPEATARALTPDGWLRTGDLVVLGEDGRMRFVSRLKEMFTVGGFNVYPAEVERVLCQHPDVLEAYVVGVEDGRLGDVPVAFVKFGPGSPGDTEAIQAYCRAHLSNYKVPRYIYPAETMPMTSSGKVEKYKLRQIAQEFIDGNEHHNCKEVY